MIYSGIKKLKFFRANGVDSTLLELMPDSGDLDPLREEINKESEERSSTDSVIQEEIKSKLIDGLLISVVINGNNANIIFTLEE